MLVDLDISKTLNMETRPVLGYCRVRYTAAGTHHRRHPDMGTVGKDTGFAVQKKTHLAVRCAAYSARIPEACGSSCQALLRRCTSHRRTPRLSIMKARRMMMSRQMSTASLQTLM